MAGHPVHRPMVRCTVAACRRWWSAPHDVSVTEIQCSCGGELEVVDMQKHVAAVPRAEELAEKKGST